LAVNGAKYREPEATAEDRTLGQLVTQISENATALVRAEIELARAEIENKVRRLTMGAAVALAAGFFVLLGLIFVFQTIAWAIVDAFFPRDIWAGFLITTLLLFIFAALAGLIAYRSFQAGAPPTPDAAIEEAQLLKEAFEHPEVQAHLAADTDPDSKPDNKEDVA
jgi:uncharacterized membrane protein YqjE